MRSRTSVALVSPWGLSTSATIYVYDGLATLPDATLLILWSLLKVIGSLRSFWLFFLQVFWYLRELNIKETVIMFFPKRLSLYACLRFFVKGDNWRALF